MHGAVCTQCYLSLGKFAVQKSAYNLKQKSHSIPLWARQFDGLHWENLEGVQFYIYNFRSFFFSLLEWTTKLPGLFSFWENLYKLMSPRGEESSWHFKLLLAPLQVGRWNAFKGEEQWEEVDNDFAKRAKHLSLRFSRSPPPAILPSFACDQRYRCLHLSLSLSITPSFVHEMTFSGKLFWASCLASA